MHKRRIGKYIILVWLPLAAAVKIDIEQDAAWKDSSSSSFDLNNRAVKSEGNKTQTWLDINGSSKRKTPAGTSANNVILPNKGPGEPGHLDKSEKKAHLHTTSLNNPDISALRVFSYLRSQRNKSAADMLPDKTEDTIRLKYLSGWIRKRRKRKKMQIPVRKNSQRYKRNLQVPAGKSDSVTDDEYENEERGHADDEEDNDNDDEVNLDELDNEDIDDGNSTQLGRYLGSPCEAACSSKLVHVFCDPTSRICECEKKYPVQIGIGRGCAKPKQLGDQCFYAQTCSFSDPNAICTQINHNAICQCKPGFHTVALRRGAKRSFCSEDQVVVSADLPTLLGVATGIAVLTGLICFVLKLFNSNRYPDHRHYDSSSMAPPLLFSNDNQWINGIPLTVHGRPSSRSSSQRSTTNLAHYSRSKGVLVPASRAGAARAAAILLIPCHLQATKSSDIDVANRSRTDDSDAQENDKENISRPGSRRPSITSIRSTTSSQRSMSYSARRFEQENQQKEQRAAMRAAREEAARLAAPPTPSPLSTDELLPVCSTIEEDEALEFCPAKTPSPLSGVTPQLDTKLNPCIPTIPRQ